MADPAGQVRQPEGIEGEGLDSYPTYRNGPVPPHHATATKPTDVNLPRSRRTYALPIFLALLAFIAAMLFYLLWGTAELSTTTQETGASPTAEQQDQIVGDEQVDAETGPGTVDSEPAPIDVPGGEVTEPAAPAEQGG